jgi:hypothetical protein
VLGLLLHDVVLNKDEYGSMADGLARFGRTQYRIAGALGLDRRAR